MILHATDRVHRGLCLAGQVCFWIPLTPRVALPGSVKCHRPQIAKFPAYLSSSAADLSTVLGLVAGLHLRRPTHRTWAPFSEASCLPGQWSSSSAPPPLTPAACLCILWPRALALPPCALTTGQKEPGLTGPPLSPLGSQWLRLFAGVFSWVGLVGQRNSS